MSISRLLLHDMVTLRLLKFLCYSRSNQVIMMLPDWGCSVLRGVRSKSRQGASMFQHKNLVKTMLGFIFKLILCIYDIYIYYIYMIYIRSRLVYNLCQDFSAVLSTH